MSTNDPYIPNWSFVDEPTDPNGRLYGYADPLGYVQELIILFMPVEIDPDQVLLDRFVEVLFEIEGFPDPYLSLPDNQKKEINQILKEIKYGEQDSFWTLASSDSIWIAPSTTPPGNADFTICSDTFTLCPDPE